MSYKELTAEDFADKTPEEIATLVSENEKGLKDSRDDWMNQANGFKGELSTKDQTIEEARQDAVKSKQAELEAQGKYEEAKALGEKERTELIAKANSEAEKARDMLKQRDLSEVHSDIMRGVHENFTPAAQALLNANTEVSYDEQGNKKVTIRHGDKEFNTTADFKEFAKTDPTWSAMLSAPNTQGVGAEGNKGGQAANGKMTLTEKAMLANSDPTFAQQFNKA
jgi:hypothetical protein